MTANPTDPSQFSLVHSAGVCGCSICSGQGLDLIPTIEAAPTMQGVAKPGLSQTSTLSALPQLSSRPGATAKLFLDFDGHTEAWWGSYSGAVTPAYDIDGDRTTFSSSELANIYEICARVAEDYAPFNIDVTTIQPGSFADRVAVRVAIGGHYNDWFGSGAGGVAYVGGFYNSASNVAYVFEDALGNGNPRYVAEAASHEAGHLFGLLHQSTWSGNTLAEAYNGGSGGWAPIMGVGYNAQRTTWHNGTTSNGPGSWQDDMSVIASPMNAFGYRPDDHGNTTTSARTIPGTDVNIAGVIERNDDIDMFSFQTAGGSVNLRVDLPQYGANLDAQLSILRSDGSVVATSGPADKQTAAITTTLTAGSYIVAVRGSQSVAQTYGNVGQYWLVGTLPSGTSTHSNSTSNPTTPSTPSTPTRPSTQTNPQPNAQNNAPGGAAAPEMDVSVAGAAFADGETVNFGSTTVGSAVTRKFTITNTGSAPLQLTPINPATLPAGFSLVENIGNRSLPAGGSTAFTLRLNAWSAGTYGGTVSIRNNDSNEGVYDLGLSGTVNAVRTQAPPPQSPVVRTIDNGDAGFTTTGRWSRFSGSGHNGDVQSAARGNGMTTANWSFTELPSGTYRVYASYPTGKTFATNSPFAVLEGQRLLGLEQINQRAAPSIPIDGSNYVLLGTYTITGNQLHVRLSNVANGFVVADAIRIEQVVDTGDNAARSALIEVEPEVVLADFVGPRESVGDDSLASLNSDRSLNDQPTTLLAGTVQQTVHLRAIDQLFTHRSSLLESDGSSAADDDQESLFAEDADWLSVVHS